MQSPRTLILLFIVACSTCLTGCKDYYNETVHWANNIKLETSINEVKNNQPSFVEINWDKPDSLAEGRRYLITKIKGSSDVLNMNNYLMFSNDGKYQGRLARK